MNVHGTNLQVISDWQMPSRSVCIFIFQLIDCKLDSSWNSTPTIRGVSSRFDTLRIEIYLIHDSGTYLVKALLGEPSMQAALWWYQVFKTEGVTGQDRWPERDLRAKLLLIWKDTWIILIGNVSNDITITFTRAHLLKVLSVPSTFLIRW